MREILVLGSTNMICCVGTARIGSQNNRWRGPELLNSSFGGPVRPVSELEETRNPTDKHPTQKFLRLRHCIDPSSLGAFNWHFVNAPTYLPTYLRDAASLEGAHPLPPFPLPRQPFSDRRYSWAALCTVKRVREIGHRWLIMRSRAVNVPGSFLGLRIRP